MGADRADHRADSGAVCWNALGRRTLVWFAILVAVNLQTAWLSPPVALSAYFLKGVVPEWDLKDIYLGMMQFMVIQVIGLALIFIFPGFALWLPDWLSAAGSPGFFSYSGYGN